MSVAIVIPSSPDDTYIDILSTNKAICNCLSNAIANQIFLIMSWLSSCINRTKAVLDRGVDQLGCPIFLPGGAVKEDWNERRRRVEAGS